MVRGETVQPASELVDFAKGAGCASDCGDVYRFHYHGFPDDHADATFLVALSPGGVRYLQQLVNECVLVFDFGEFRD